MSSFSIILTVFGTLREETGLRGFTNNYASAQTDQGLCYSFLESIIYKLATMEVSIF